MIKTVKVKKNMRLDELIKYVWENSATEKRVFIGNHGQRVVFDNVGGFYPSGYAYSPDTTFTVEVEEEITDYTVFKSALAVHHGEELELYENLSIKGFKYRWPNSLQMHAVINGKLELVWEAE